MLDLIVKNGTLVTSHSVMPHTHVLVKDGKVVGLSWRDELPEAKRVIDATGLHVLPGLIDPHVHFRVPGVDYKEDFEHGSKAAVAGGITTVIDMPNVKPPTSDVESLQMKIDAGRGNSWCDWGTYAVMLEGKGDQIIPLVEAGVLGFKIFLGATVGNIPAPSDGEILEQWAIMAETGRRCGLHAEDNSILFYLADKLKKEGRVDPLAFVEHRPPVAEVEAISRAALFAKYTGAKILIYHLSSGDGVDCIRDWKDRGVDIMAETGPHYLITNQYDMVNFDLGTLLKMNPPVRGGWHAQKLWEGLRDGTVDVIGTDHSPHTEEEKMLDNPMGEIWKAQPGWPGVETNVPLMLTQVNYGQLTLPQYVRVQSEMPAKAWGMWPEKGNLNKGADADITIVDMNKEGVIDRHKIHSKPKVTPFDGFHYKGAPVYTIVRGHVQMENGVVVGEPIGQYVKHNGR